MMREILSGHLNALGVYVTSVLNGRQAIEALKMEDPFHLIITDVSMPVMGGFELLEKLKADPQTAQIPVIIVTGDEKNEPREQALNLGAADFTVKPIKEEEFTPHVRRFLGWLTDCQFPKRPGSASING